MVNLVKLSPHTRDLFPLLRAALPVAGENLSPDETSLLEWLDQNEPQLDEDQPEINTLVLVDWFNKAITLDKKAQLLLESLRAALLLDICNAVPDSAELADRIDRQPHKAFFRFLTIAGVTVAICEGFDGIASILGLFPAISPLYIFAAGVVFAALSVTVFCGFDLVAIAANLGLNIGTTHQLIDIFLEEVKQLDKIREAINSRHTKGEAEERRVLLEISRMLIGRYNALDEAREKYKGDLNNPYVRAAKLVTSLVAGVIFFGAGFFSGQSLVLVTASLFTTTVSALFWPVIVACTVAGLAAFCIYWFVQRPGLESLVSRWLGTDEEKINALIDVDVIARQRRELELLVTQIEQFEELHQQLENNIAVYAEQPVAAAADSPIADHIRFFRPQSPFRQPSTSSFLSVDLGDDSPVFDSGDGLPVFAGPG